jgi:hypothetical protein
MARSTLGWRGRAELGGKGWEPLAPAKDVAAALATLG